MKIISFALIMIILSACSLSNQSAQQFPAWWQEQEPGQICSYGFAVHQEENIARLAAQNDAFHNFKGLIMIHLNSYVAENCIEPGDELIQAELQKIFQYFINYLMNLDQPAIEMGESSFDHSRIKTNKVVRCYAQLKMEQRYLHNEFVEFLATADFYIAPKLRSVLRECFD